MAITYGPYHAWFLVRMFTLIEMIRSLELFSSIHLCGSSLVKELLSLLSGYIHVHSSLRL